MSRIAIQSDLLRAIESSEISGNRPPHPVKITLNTTSIPENRRPQVEALVKSLAKDTEVIWLPSRFPRFVMFVEPGPQDKSSSEGGSIFESPEAGARPLASVTEFLEQRIKACLAETSDASSAEIRTGALRSTRLSAG